MSVTKADIVKAIHKEIGFPKRTCALHVETLVELIKNALASGDEVLISGFGKFSVLEKSERKGRNPATGEAMMLKPRRVVTFKCSGKLRDHINNHGGNG